MFNPILGGRFQPILTTLPETNKAPKNGRAEYLFPFEKGLFSGALAASFRECNIFHSWVAKKNTTEAPQTTWDGEKNL